MWQIWLIASGVFFIIEMFTIGFLIFWLGIGALLAMVVSCFTTSIIIQTATFVISSALLIFATRPLVNKIVKKDATPTNDYSLVGKKAIVIEEIDWTSGKGQIKCEGEIWSAKTKEQPISLIIFLKALLHTPAIGAKTTLFFISIFPILNIKSPLVSILTQNSQN